MTAFFKLTAKTLVAACAALALASGAQAGGGHGGGGGSGHGGGFHGGAGGWHSGGGGGGGGGWHGGGHHEGGYHGGGHRHGGWGWGGVGLGLGFGLGVASSNYYYGGYGGYPYYGDPGYVVADQPPVVVYAPSAVYGAPVPSGSSLQPVIYPRNGQSPQQTDADANACSEWAGKQPNATTDASVFRRSTEACMDARGYTVR